MWQARYMIPYRTAVGPANTNFFTCIPIVPFNNIGTCGWCISCMFLRYTVASTPPNPPDQTKLVTLPMTYIALDTAEWRPLQQCHSRIRHTFLS